MLLSVCFARLRLEASLNKIKLLLFFPLAARHRRREIQRLGCSIASPSPSLHPPGQISWQPVMLSHTRLQPSRRVHPSSAISSQQASTCISCRNVSLRRRREQRRWAVSFLFPRRPRRDARSRKVQIFSIFYWVNQLPASWPGAPQKMKFVQLELLFERKFGPSCLFPLFTNPHFSYCFPISYFAMWKHCTVLQLGVTVAHAWVVWQ